MTQSTSALRTASAAHSFGTDDHQSSISDRSSAKDLLARHKKKIDHLINRTAARRGICGPDRDDFLGWCYLRLVEDDYRRIRAFRGTGSLTGYLLHVLQNLSHDFANHLWGKWRPSAAAERHGTIGVRLDTLINRDGFSTAEAIQIVLHEGGELNAEEMHSVASRLNRGPACHLVSLEEVHEIPAPGTSDPQLPEPVHSALWTALGSLPADDRALITSRYIDGLPPRALALLTGSKTTTIYRRLPTILKVLRRSMVKAGITESQATSSVLDLQ